MRASGSVEVTCAINSEASGSPGTMVRRPDLPTPRAASRKINDTPFFCRTPPWHATQFWLKMGRISRLKSTGLRNTRENRGAAWGQHTHTKPAAPSERATIAMRRERNANLVGIYRGRETPLVIAGSPSNKCNSVCAIPQSRQAITLISVSKPASTISKIASRARGVKIRSTSALGWKEFPGNCRHTDKKVQAIRKRLPFAKNFMHKPHGPKPGRRPYASERSVVEGAMVPRHKIVRHVAVSRETPIYLRAVRTHFQGRHVFVCRPQSQRTLHASDLLWLAKSIAGCDCAVV